MTLPRRASGVARAACVERPLVTRDLRPYQAEGARWLRARSDAGRSCLLGDEMGLGKTAQALRALPGPALVVCPASVLLTWEEEAARWRPDLHVSRHDGRAPREGTLATTSYDGVGELLAQSSWLVPDDMSRVTLILDEAHRASHADAQRTEKVRRLVRQCGGAWGLTGTPMTGTPRDLLGLLVTLGLLEEAFPGGEDEYHALCQRTVRSGRSRRTGAAYSTEEWGDIDPEVPRRLSRVMLRRRRADHLDLPPARWVDVPCPAPRDLREYLDRLTEAWTGYDPRELPPFELYSAATAALARSRAALARDLALDVSRERQVLVFSAHVAPVEEVASACGGHRITGAETEAERARVVRDFRAGKIRVLPMTMQAGGEGLNLPEAGAVIVVDEAYVPSVTDQAVARALRPGQRHDEVLVYRMTSRHVLDQRIREILDEKRRMIGQAVERVKFEERTRELLGGGEGRSAYPKKVITLSLTLTR